MTAILDSGKREEFESGAVRDTQEGRGRSAAFVRNVNVHLKGQRGGRKSTSDRKE